MGFGSFVKGAIKLGTGGLVDIDKLTGSDQADAAKQAAGIQAASGQASIDFQRESRDLARADLAPYVNYGTAGIGRVNDFLAQENQPLSAATSLLTPEGQYNYLSSNPMFDAAVENSTRGIKALNAAGGRSGGGVVDQLFKNYLATGDQFLANQFSRIGAVDTLRGNEFNRLLSPINTGLGAATGQANVTQATGQSVGNTITDVGNANAAGVVGAENARTGAYNNLLGFAGNIGGSLLGGAGGLSGISSLIFSDERLKDVEEKIGEDEKGLPIYKWKYKGDDITHYGPMAQDVALVNPEAVYVHKSGNLLLDMREV